MTDRRDYYDVLGVERSATQKQIKKAYREMARQYHPDVSDVSDAEVRFKEINEAYEVLSDTDKRATYDQFGHAGLNNNGGRGFGGFGFSDPFEIFEEVFGQGFGFRTSSRRGPRRGADLRYNLDLTFEEAIFGCEKEISLSRYEACPTCQGSGAEPGTSTTRCSKCNGTGQVRQVQRSILGSFVNVTTCPTCQGTGKTIPHPCGQCKGERRIYASHKLAVNVPPGVGQGTQIRLAGEGEMGKGGGPPGNLYVVLDVKSHPIFQRRDDDILIEMQINVAQATLGADVKVPTLEGEEEISIPPGTQSGTVLRLRDKGVPHLRRNGRGNQLVLVRVAVPDKLTNEQRQLFQELDKTLEPESVWKGKEKRGLMDDLREMLGL